MSAVAKRASSSRPASATSLLLACGIAAGPLYVVVGALEMFTRPGFDPLRHDLSLMANGDLVDDPVSFDTYGDASRWWLAVVKTSLEPRQLVHGSWRRRVL